jgi:hypothetical protein
MRFTIVALQDHLRAELFDRESVEETREFLAALAEEALRRGSPRILICVSAARPIFKVGDYRAGSYLKQLAALPTVKVALVSIHRDIRAAHEHIEVLAREQGANVRSFAEEAPALRWLRTPLEAPLIVARPGNGAPKNP